jgi:hypothetical protein
MILSVLLIARIASRWLPLRRHCAQATLSDARRRLRPALALQTRGSNLATTLTPTLTITSGVPAGPHSTHHAV